MAGWRKVIGWLALLLAGIALVGLGIYFGHIGLDRADKLASVLGALSGLVGLFLAGWGIVQARHEPPRLPDGDGNGNGQVVSGSMIGRDNIQIGSARDIDIRREPS